MLRSLADKITKAQNFQEILTLQTRFAQDQMQAVAAQTQEFHKLIGGRCPERRTPLTSREVPAPEIGCGSVTENAARIRLQPSGTQS